MFWWCLNKNINCSLFQLESLKVLEARKQEAATRLEEAVYRGEKVLTEVTSEEFIRVLDHLQILALIGII